MIFLSETWWAGLQTAEKVYWFIALPFTAVFLFQLVLTFLGGDTDHFSFSADHDVTFDGDHGVGFQFLSIKNLIGFFAIMGWTGIAMLNAGKSLGITVFVSVLAGFLMMVIMAAMVYYLSKLTEQNVLTLSNAIGKTGTVYLRIPAERKGMGQVQINVQGFQTLNAVTDEKEEIKTGALIRVVDSINNEILLVKPQ
jgi:membrane protein implicated in regulation of membrane protease activity